MKLRNILYTMAAACTLSVAAQSQKNMVDGVVWVVGDQPILLSEVEEARLATEAGGTRVEHPYCVLPERLAVQKLFLHQADIDSIYADKSAVDHRVKAWLEDAIQYYGSRENVEAWARRSVAQLKKDRRRALMDESRVEQVKHKIVSKVKVTPAEVREYFKGMPQDSLPFIPEQVSVEIITYQPRVKREEVERVEARLREFAHKVNTGESSFSTLARFYSEDPGSARMGGEIGYKSRGQLVPEYANVAFALHDPKKVSKIVRSEFGYHIIQLIDKRGDKVNTRHILLHAEIPDSQYVNGCERLDKVGDDIRAHKYTFEAAAPQISDDKDTRNNKGLMNNIDMQTGSSTSRFKLEDLNPEIAKVVDTLKVDEVSRAFTFTNQKGQKVCAIVKLVNRIEGHRANMTEDFQSLKAVVQAKRSEEKIDRWIEQKAAKTYVRVMPGWRNCQFKYHWNL